MSEIVLHRKKPTIQRDGCVIRIDDDAKYILMELKMKTGLPISHIASEFIIQASKNVVVIDNEF